MFRFYLKVGLSGKDKHLLATNQLDNSSEALLSWAAKQTFASPLTNKQWADDVLLKHFYFDPLFVKNPRRNHVEMPLAQRLTCLEGGILLTFPQLHTQL